MASIGPVALTLGKVKSDGIVDTHVTASVAFDEREMCIMSLCNKAKWFKVKCMLLGINWTGAYTHLWTYQEIFYYPDANPSQQESVVFDHSLSQGNLDVDTDPFTGLDLILARVEVVKLFTGQKVHRDSTIKGGSFS